MKIILFTLLAVATHALQASPPLPVTRWHKLHSQWEPKHNKEGFSIESTIAVTDADMLTTRAKAQVSSLESYRLSSCILT